MEDLNKDQGNLKKSESAGSAGLRGSLRVPLNDEANATKASNRNSKVLFAEDPHEGEREREGEGEEGGPSRNNSNKKRSSKKATSRHEEDSKRRSGMDPNDADGEGNGGGKASRRSMIEKNRLSRAPDSTSRQNSRASIGSSKPVEGFEDLFETAIKRREQRERDDDDGEKRQTVLTEGAMSIGPDGNLRPSTKKKPRFSQIFNFEQDFKVVLEQEKEREALEMFPVKPNRIVLQKIYEKGKIKEIAKERLNKIPTREDLKDYIPGIRDFSVYILQLILLVLATVAYSLIDIFFYRAVFDVDKNKDGISDNPDRVALYATTVNLIGVCFDFLWKYVNCLLVYPNALTTWYSKGFFGALGCVVHCLAILAIRYPLYVSAKDDSTCPNGYVFLTGSLVYLTLTYLLDFFFMPLMFRRLDPIGKDIIRSKVVAGELKPPVIFIGLATLAWILVWYILVHISVFVRPEHLGVAMEIVLWVPMVTTSLLSFIDKGKGLIHNVQYLIFFLWFVYLIPQMTASILSAFVFLQSTSFRFLLSLIFIGLAQVFMTVTSNAAQSMGDGGPTVHFIFAAQLFESFFGAVFFVNVTLDALFWLMLFLQSFWLTFRNSGVFKDMTVWTYYKFVQPKLQQWGIPLFQNMTFESSRSRLYFQARMAVQYTICDFTVLLGIPLQYFLNTTYMNNIDQLQQYAWFFQMTLCEHDQGLLYIRFLIVAFIKLLFHIFAHTLLWYKVRSYNQQSASYGLPTISFIGIFSEYLKKYWVYFIVIVLYCMKASYIAFSVIISSELSNQQRKAGAEAFEGLDGRDVFWLQDLLVFVGYRFVSPETDCGAISNSTIISNSSLVGF